MFWVGILLIISAGSFLYIASMHVLPEALSKHHLTTKDMACMVLGLVLPLGLTLLEDE